MNPLPNFTAYADGTLPFFGGQNNTTRIRKDRPTRRINTRPGDIRIVGTVVKDESLLTDKRSWSSIANVRVVGPTPTGKCIRNSYSEHVYVRGAVPCRSHTSMAALVLCPTWWGGGNIFLYTYMYVLMQVFTFQRRSDNQTKYF